MNRLASSKFAFGDEIDRLTAAEQSESHVRQSGRIKLISRLIVNISPVLRSLKESFAKPDADADRQLQSK
jgi:hypothetical protein